MRQSLVNRSVIVLSGLLALACAGFAWVVEHPARALPTSAQPPGAEPAPSAAAGAGYFATRCARCHEPAEAAGPLVRGADRATATAAMRSFLRRHAKSPVEEDAAIIAFLVAQSGSAPQPADDSGH